MRYSIKFINTSSLFLRKLEHLMQLLEMYRPKCVFEYIFFVCIFQARIGSTAIGTSMALGALLMKTYRVHMIFSRAITKLKRVVSLL